MIDFIRMMLKKISFQLSPSKIDPNSLNKLNNTSFFFFLNLHFEQDASNSTRMSNGKNVRKGKVFRQHYNEYRVNTSD